MNDIVIVVFDFDFDVVCIVDQIVVIDCIGFGKSQIFVFYQCIMVNQCCSL